MKRKKSEGKDYLESDMIAQVLLTAKEIPKIKQPKPIIPIINMENNDMFTIYL